MLVRTSKRLGVTYLVLVKRQGMWKKAALVKWALATLHDLSGYSTKILKVNLQGTQTGLAFTNKHGAQGF